MSAVSSPRHRPPWRPGPMLTCALRCSAPPGEPCSEVRRAKRYGELPRWPRGLTATDPQLAWPSHVLGAVVRLPGCSSPRPGRRGRAAGAWPGGRLARAPCPPEPPAGGRELASGIARLDQRPMHAERCYLVGQSFTQTLQSELARAVESLERD